MEWGRLGVEKSFDNSGGLEFFMSYMEYSGFGPQELEVNEWLTEAQVKLLIEHLEKSLEEFKNRE